MNKNVDIVTKSINKNLMVRFKAHTAQLVLMDIYTRLLFCSLVLPSGTFGLGSQSLPRPSLCSGYNSLIIKRKRSMLFMTVPTGFF